ncbi:hypothetical protein H8356DRAFT_1438134, partial [Neocallimastix lanati (nom. inval.)]
MKQYQYLKLKDWKLLIIDFVANAVVDDVDAVDVVFDIVVGVVVMNGFKRRKSIFMATSTKACMSYRRVKNFINFLNDHERKPQIKINLM